MTEATKMTQVYWAYDQWARGTGHDPNARVPMEGKDHYVVRLTDHERVKGELNKTIDELRARIEDQSGLIDNSSRAQQARAWEAVSEQLRAHNPYVYRNAETGMSAAVNEIKRLQALDVTLGRPADTTVSVTLASDVLAADAERAEAISEAKDVLHQAIAGNYDTKEEAADEIGEAIDELIVARLG